jgi:glycosyltransferase involved in cell wall biosynthesis
MNLEVTPGLVSVIVASYNHAEFLNKRMDSLLAQTYQNLEIFVIDDCSQDRSVEILRKYESNPKIKLIIREKNGGWETVSNQGLAMTSGEYVMISNCDDDCSLDLIERLVTFAESNPTTGITFCRSFLVDKDDNIIGNDFDNRESSFRFKCTNDTLLTAAETNRFLLHSCIIPNLSSALFRRNIFEKTGNFTSEYHACGDWDLFFRIAKYFDFGYISEPLNRFRQHETTIRSLMTDRETLEEYFRLLLGQIKLLDLTLIERTRYRTNVMFMWAAHIIRPSLSGINNIPHHLMVLLKYDGNAVLFILPAIILRVMQLIKKVVSGRTPKFNYSGPHK